MPDEAWRAFKRAAYEQFRQRVFKRNGRWLVHGTVYCSGRCVTQTSACQSLQEAVQVAIETEYRSRQEQGQELLGISSPLIRNG